MPFPFTICLKDFRTFVCHIFVVRKKLRRWKVQGNEHTQNFTFMLPCCIIRDFFLNNQPDAPIILNLFCYKALHVSGILSAHHQEFSTVYSALVSFMQLSDDRFQAESGWNCSVFPS
jgi:hypothetical protein